MKNRILLDSYFFPAGLEAQIEVFVDHYNHQRYHESINNLTPADVHFGRVQAILKITGKDRTQNDGELALEIPQIRHLIS